MKTHKKLKVVVIESTQSDLALIERAIDRLETINRFEITGYTETTEPLQSIEKDIERPPCAIILDYNAQGGMITSSSSADIEASDSIGDIIRRDLQSLAFIREIRSIPHLRHVPVIMYSTSFLKKDVEAAYDAGATSYIVKEIHTAASDFLHEVESILSYWVDFNVSPNSGL